MSVKDIYNKAEEKEECRVCGIRCEKDKIIRGRCSNCNYKNLEPEE